MMALIISPGIKVNDNKKALLTGICIMKPIIIVPTISKNKTPITNVVTNNTAKLILLKYWSLTKPMPNATTGYKNKNPADGPANTPIPPRPPERTGKPATANSKRLWHWVPHIFT